MIKMLKEADSPALKTLAGTALIKLATGIISIWGTINIYFFSYLRNKGTEITPMTNSIIMLCVLIPSSFSVLISTRLTNLFGYKTIIRVCGLIFAFSPFLINFGMNQFVLGLFYQFIPINCFGISSIPILNCLWSHFPKDLNKVSGLAILFFSLGSITWNMMFTALINPNNQSAFIDENQLAYFKKEISDHIFKASNAIFLCSGICFLVGSMLIQKKITQKSIDKLSPQSPPKQKSLTDEKILPTLAETLKDKKFITLFSISYLVPLYLIYLNLYMKLIFMPIINDDHFLALCYGIITFSAIIGAPFWGFIGDKMGFKFTLLIVIFIDLLCKISGLFCTQKWNLVILYFMLGFNDKGIMTIIGPGLIQIFGLEMATELIPYKGISLFLAYVTVPIIQLLTAKLLTYKHILMLFICTCCGALYLSYYFYKQLHYKPFHQEFPENQEEEKQNLFEEKKMEIFVI